MPVRSTSGLCLAVDHRRDGLDWSGEKPQSVRNPLPNRNAIAGVEVGQAVANGNSEAVITRIKGHTSAPLLAQVRRS